MNLSRKHLFESLSWRVIASVLALLLLAISVEAESPSALYKKGEDLEARQDYEAAYSAYLEAWQQKPKDVKYRAAAARMRFLAGAAHVHRGQQLREAGKLEDALQEFQKAAAIDPSSFIASQEIQRTRVMIEAAKTAPTAKAPAPPSFIQRKLEQAEAAPVELEPISNQPITLKMTEDSKLIYETVGRLAGINVLFDLDYPARRIHVELTGVTLAQALRLIALESRTFWRPVTPNTIFVAVDTPAKRKELQESVIKTFYLSHLSQTTELQDVVGALRTLLEVNRVTPIPNLGAIVVRATPDEIALVDKLINDLDKERAEVVVDVAVMQVSRDRIHDLGVTLPTSATVYPSSNVIATSTSNPPPATTTVSTGTAPGTINFGHVDGTSFAVSIPSATANFLFSNGNAKVIQNPQIRAADGQKATLKIGDRVPVATGSFSAGVSAGGVSPLVNTQFQYLDVGVNVDITPFVHGDRSVTLKISMDVSSVTGSVNVGGISQPIIGQRRIEHEVRLKEGEVNLLGGILEDSDIKAVSGYPGLANVPILKYLFSDQHTENHQNEIVFVLTPHIIRAPEVSEANLRPLSVGTGSTIELSDGELGPAKNASGPAGNSSAPSPTAPSSVSQQAGPQTAQASQQPPAAKAVAPAPPAAAQGTAAAATSQIAQMGESVQLSFNPSRLTTTVGQTLTVEVMVSNARNLSSVPIQLQYDAAKLQVVNVSNGGFLEQGQQVVALTQHDDPTTGSVRITAMRPPDAAGATGSGSLLTLTFMAKAGGNTTLSIARAGLRNADNQPVAASGTPAVVEIKAPSATQALVETKR